MNGRKALGKECKDFYGGFVMSICKVWAEVDCF